MNTPPTPPKRGLPDNIDALINTAVNAPTGPAGYRSITTAKHLNGGEPPDLNLKRLVNELWKQIAVNWVEGRCQARGKFNWRLELRPTGGESDGQPEVALQRRIARFIENEGRAECWSNETPTGSGLSEGASGDPGGLDFAYQDDAGDITLIELKVGSYTPVSAAFQVVIYGLLLTLARLVDKQIKIITNDVWRDTKHAHLRVLAPTSFYSDYLGLGWFEKRLDEAVSEFGSAHDLPMRFAFREFTAEPTTESELIERLGEKGKIPWK